MKRERITLNFKLKPITRHILEKLGYINKNGKVIAEYGALSEFINQQIINGFSDNEAIKVSWFKSQIRSKFDEKQKLEKEMVDLAQKVQEIHSLAEQEGIDIEEKERKLGQAPIKQNWRNK